MWVLLALTALDPEPECQPFRSQGRVWTTPTSPSANLPRKAWTHFFSPGRSQWLFPRLRPSSSSPGTYRDTSGLLAPVEWTITPLTRMVRPAR